MTTIPTEIDWTHLENYFVRPMSNLWVNACCLPCRDVRTAAVVSTPGVRSKGRKTTIWTQTQWIRIKLMVVAVSSCKINFRHQRSRKSASLRTRIFGFLLVAHSFACAPVSIDCILCNFSEYPLATHFSNRQQTLWNFDFAAARKKRSRRTKNGSVSVDCNQ